MSDALRDLEAALSGLWSLPPPGPRSSSDPAYRALNAALEMHYGVRNAFFAQNNALHSLGMPSYLPREALGRSLAPSDAARLLDLALRRRTVRRRHLCPLDLAEGFPALRFGPARVDRFSAAELTELFDAPRLARHYPTSSLQLEVLAQFHWLVIEEKVEVDSAPEARAMPFLFSDMRRDLGETVVHARRYPAIVETVLSFLLLAPWEEWSDMLEVNWRGFVIPWIHTVDEDLFVHPSRPPTPDALTIVEYATEVRDGVEVELERPETFRLKDGVINDLAAWDADAWDQFSAAIQGPLFETPVLHFLLQGYASSDMDEIMAHMTTIEAAVGHIEDQKPEKGAPHPGIRGSARVRTRVSGLLGDPAMGETYGRLFSLRSEYVHGRGGMEPVSTTTRVEARALARAVVVGLLERARKDGASRDAVLAALLDEGVVAAAVNSTGSPES